MYKTLSCALLLCCGGFAAAGPAPPDAAGCTSCHGDSGVSHKPDVPTIAGMSAPYLVAQMGAYQKSQRPCAKMSGTDMCEVAKKLTAAQIGSLSSYYAAQKFVPAAQSIDAALAAKGKALFGAHCALCHSDGGSQAADDAGILAGQWKSYLQTTLQDYVSGKRVQPDPMKRQTMSLAPADVKALAEYFASEGH
jgi:cytochrome subunit of sulfide dehydrogenase